MKMDTDKTVSKVFSETKYTLTITEPTGGNITSDVGDINCGSKGTTCEAEFDKVVEVTLTAKADTGYVLRAWQGACDKTDADQPCKLVMDTDMAAGLTLAIDPNDIDGDGEPNETDVDDDNDGLIEIHNLDMFNHIRYNLAGTAYKAGSSATASIIGAPTGSPTANCKTATDGVYLCGYELMRDLDFNEDSSYASGSTNKSVWQPDDSNPDRASNAGFEGIEDGFGEEGFPSIFEGNGYTISNLYSRNTNSMSPGDGEDGKPRARVGLFKSIEANATIRNLGVVDARLYGSAFGNEQIGSLVSKNKGNILACHATGKANGGDGVDYIGGLVGANTTGTIIDSHATVAVDGDAGKDRVGGLVGYNNKGSIRNSHATGAVNGDTGNDRVGGLVGRNKGNISLSYTTGAVTGSTGNNQDIGGLVGWNDKDGRITASYATGVVRDDGNDGSIGGLVGYNKGSIVASHVTGGTIRGSYIVGGLVGRNDGSISASYVTGGTIRGSYIVGGLVGRNDGSISASYVTGGTIEEGDHVGGLVGENNGSISASYATGAVNGNSLDYNRVGGLVGYNKGSISASYATGDVDGGDGDTDRVGALVGANTGNIRHSYAFGTTANVDTPGNAGTAHPTGLGSISDKADKVNALTIGAMANTDVDASWDNAGQKTLNAWDFGTSGQAPALKYADYDGDMTGKDYCALFPDKIPETDDDLQCGSSLLPGQGR